MSTDKKLIIAAAVVLVLAGAAGVVGNYQDARDSGSPWPVYGTDQDGFYTNSTSTDNGTGGGAGTVCTMDAYQCPDGSWVGRTGPNCEFVCPEATTTPSSRLTGELVGTVMLGPTCPVEQNPPQPQCADKPYQTTILVSTGGREVGRQETDAQGRFHFAFLPGTYSVTALGGNPLPRCADETAVLTKGATTTVSISCDTGIR